MPPPMAQSVNIHIPHVGSILWSRFHSMMKLVVLCALLATAFISANAAGPVTDFVHAANGQFMLNGAPYRFAGTNVYYLHYMSQHAVDDVLNRAAAVGIQTVRMWTFIDVGHADGSGSIDGPHNGYYLQYFDPTINGPRVNDANFTLLDYAISKCGQLGMRAVLSLVNNWRDFGGMDQYVQWRVWAGQADSKLPAFTPQHDSFYDDPIIRGWYQNWVKHLLERTNAFTGKQYKNDPAIFSLELANEPRCQGSGTFPSSDQCVLNYAVYGKDPVAKKIGDWVSVMAAFVKSIDTNHLVAVGDEGFYCERYEVCPDYLCACYPGVDTIKFASDPSIDYMSLHLYPTTWGKDVNWGTQYIVNHTKQAQQLGKPVFMGEFGMPGQGGPAPQNTIYQQWGDVIYDSGMNADAVWILSGRMDDGSWYGNYDTFGVYCPRSGDPAIPSSADSQTCGVITQHAQRMSSGNH